MYIELDRADARGRRELVEDLHAVLADVRAAVRDWPQMQAQMREDAAKIEDPEGGALLNWFADGALTLLGYEVERPGEDSSSTLGIFSIPGAPTDKGGSVGAIRYFEAGGAVRKAISVLKKRTGPHESAIREFEIRSDRLEVGEPLSAFRGVLTGVPEFTGAAETLFGVHSDTPA